MRIFHLIRELDDPRAVATAEEQKRLGHQVTVLLLHDAVLSQLSDGPEVMACADDTLARSAEGRYPTVDYDEIVKMISNADRVIVW